MLQLKAIRIYFRTVSGWEYVQEQDVSAHDFATTTKEQLQAEILADTAKQLTVSKWWTLQSTSGAQTIEQVWSGCFETYRVELVE